MTDDVRDILEIERVGPSEVTKETILGPERKMRKLSINTPKMAKRPEGMAREVFALLYNDNKDAPPLFPTDTGLGYKKMKAKLSMKNVRPWKWMPFTNPARKDSAVFHHWRRITDQPTEYPFAKFNKKVFVPDYSDDEYRDYLESTTWTRQDTDQLLDLARRFDLRWGVMADRWTSSNSKSIEDLKERYYQVLTTLAKGKTMPGVHQDAKNYVYDSEHERKRKEQLLRLYKRTPQQVEEEQMLQNELRKIEARKKERDKKTQDLQKLITAADSQGGQDRKIERKIPRKKIPPAAHLRHPRVENFSGDVAGIKFPDGKASGVTLRSQRMKLPANIGQKKAKAIEQLLSQLNIQVNPMPTEEICVEFNELRNDLVLLYELKTAMASCEFELQALRHQYEATNPGKTLLIPKELCIKKEEPDEVPSTSTLKPEPSLSQTTV